jgi:hypothetical protein
MRLAILYRPPLRLPTAIAAVVVLALSIGCHSLRLNGPTDGGDGRASGDNATAAPTKYSLRVAPYVFFSNVELSRDDPTFKDLAGLRDQVAKELQLPPGNAVIQVFLFEDRDHYERYLEARYPYLPKRPAFFLAQPRAIGGEDLIVYTFSGDKVQKNLRHELTHALVHSVIRDVPIWLDEGLAEYFELPADSKGVNAGHLANLRGGPLGPTKPDLVRLEKLTEVQQMRPEEYREAWAWVHLMLRGQPEARAALLAYLRDLRTNSAPGTLGTRLADVFTSPDDAFDRHLERLDAAAQIDAQR